MDTSVVESLRKLFILPNRLELLPEDLGRYIYSYLKIYYLKI